MNNVTEKDTEGIVLACPCCEHESDTDKWYEISNDYHAICPVCDNVVQYSEFEEENKMNTLYFEGAGMDFYGEEQTNFSNVGNFRIRTAFKNLDGKKIYLEMGNANRRGLKSKRSKKETVISKWALRIDHIHEITDGDDDENENRITFDRKGVNSFDYSTEDIAKWINDNLNCNFDTIEVLDGFQGYRVHGDHGSNLMDDFEVNYERTAARKEAYDRIDREYREALNEKYSKIGLVSMDDDGINIRCYASKESMAKTDLPREQRIEVDGNETQLYTYGTERGDMVFTVPSAWLLTKIDGTIDDYLDEYTHDDSANILLQAKDEGIARHLHCIDAE